MSITNIESLHKIRAENPNKKIGFCSGSFDLTHLGHILFFEDCKKLCDILVVSIGDDYSIKSLKGSGRPILNQEIRLRTIDSLRPVDFALLNTIDKENIFCDLEKIFLELNPDKYFINEDAFDIDARKVLSNRHGITLNILGRTCPQEYDAISTTSIIKKVLSAYSI